MPDSVLDIIHRLSATRSVGEIVEVVSHAVRTLLDADGATFALRDGDHCYYAGEDAVSPLWKERRLPMSGCLAGWCMTNRQAVAIPDIYQDPRVFTEVFRPAFVRGLAVAPVGQDDPVAVLGAYWSEERRPRRTELERLKAIADGAALAMARLQVLHAGSPDPPGAAARTPPERREYPDLDIVPLRTSVERFLHQGLPPNSPWAYAFAVGCVMVATLLGMGVQATGVAGLTGCAFYYPAVLLALLSGGMGPGTLAAALGGLAFYYFMMEPRYTWAPLTTSDGLNLTLYASASGLTILIVGSYKRMVQRLKEEDARHLTVAREQQHRAKNAVVVAEAIIRQSLRTDPLRALVINRRIRAAFADIDINLRSRPIRMPTLLTHELEAFDLSRFTFDGDPRTLLVPDVSSLVALAAHELGTNAFKYGALSVPEGTVTLAWRVVGDRLTILWREARGPPVQPPKGSGYGSIMLRRLVEASGGQLVSEFPTSGAVVELSLRLDGKRSRRSPGASRPVVAEASG